MDLSMLLALIPRDFLLDCVKTNKIKSLRKELDRAPKPAQILFAKQIPLTTANIQKIDSMLAAMENLGLYVRDEDLEIFSKNPTIRNLLLCLIEPLDEKVAVKTDDTEDVIESKLALFDKILRLF